MRTSPPNEITRLLLRWSRGDKSVLDQLMPVVYEELRKLAHGFLRRERPDHTLQPTALINEAYLRLVKQDFPEYQSYFSLEGIDTGSKQYPNFNTLIGRFDGADGMKTGFICASGFNQIGSATRDGRSAPGTRTSSRTASCGGTTRSARGTRSRCRTSSRSAAAWPMKSMPT